MEKYYRLTISMILIFQILSQPITICVQNEYDALNRLSKTKQPLGRNTSYKYDNNSNVTEITDPKGQTSVMSYDALDRLDTAIYKDELNSEKLRHKYNYYQEDLLESVVETRSGSAERTYTRIYDQRNRLTEAKDAYNKTVKFGYDAANNLKTLTDATNKITTYNYDGKNQLDTVVQNNQTVADYDWYADGLLKQVKYSDTQKRDFVYDDADRVTNISNTIGANSESFDYGYDANSNRESEIRKANGQAFRTLNYGYDKLDRLSQVRTTTPNGTNPAVVSQIDYTYDAVGNRKTEVGTDQNGAAINRTATFDDLNQLTQLTSGSLTETFDYDRNGNLSSRKQNNVEVERFEYDVRNQLTRVADGTNTELAKFDYDFERKRLSKTSANFRTDYVYAGNSIVSEYQNGVASASYTIGAGEVVKSDFTVEGARYYFSDALGSTTSLSDTNGSLTARNEYDAFGLQSSSGNTANSIGYTGQRLDYETGLMALGNGERYYSPNYARFIQQDSWLGNNVMPQSMNRFSYAYNNPFKYVDPSGNEGVFSKGTKWTGNETADYWLNFTGSLLTSTPTREKLGQSLELWNSWALGVGDAFQTTGEGIGNFAGGILYGDADKTLGDAWKGIKETASLFGEIAAHPIQGFNVLTDAAMNDPHAFMRAIGKSSGEVVIAETGAKVTAPITRPITSAIKRTAINAGSRLISRIGETAAGRAVTRVATETVEQAGTRLSSSVERIGQLKNSLKESVGETWQKLKSGGSETPKRKNWDLPNDEFNDSHIYRRESSHFEVEIDDAKGVNLGEFDEVKFNKKGGQFIEDKSAKGLNILNPKTKLPAQTAAQWAEKQIYQKTVTRIENLLNNASSTRRGKTSLSNIPSYKEIKGIRNLKFRIESDTPQLRKAVRNEIEKLSKDYPDWNFDAEFGF